MSSYIPYSDEKSAHPQHAYSTPSHYIVLEQPTPQQKSRQSLLHRLLIGATTLLLLSLTVILSCHLTMTHDATATDSSSLAPPPEPTDTWKLETHRRPWCLEESMTMKGNEWWPNQICINWMQQNAESINFSMEKPDTFRVCKYDTLSCNTTGTMQDTFGNCHNIDKGTLAYRVVKYGQNCSAV